MKSIPTILALAIIAVAGTEIRRVFNNDHVVKNCHGVYKVVYDRGAATCRSVVQVQGPAQPIQD